MANKPERFDQNKIWKNSISPAELETWVNYVKEEVFESVKKIGEKLSSTKDIKTEVQVLYETPYIEGSKHHGNISVNTYTPEGYDAAFTIAKFECARHAKETFDEYTKFKKISTWEKDKLLFKIEMCSV